MSPESLLAYLLASGLLAIAPGPDNIFVMTQSALYGRQSGVVVTLGLCTGLMVHTLAVSLGLAALFAASPLAFNALKYLGAAYLLYLAWQALTSPALSTASERLKASGKTLYLRGIIMNVSNPKISIFFLAFLPQFVSIDTQNSATQFLILGGLFALLTLIIFSLIACVAGSLSQWLTRSTRRLQMLNYLAGVVFVGLAARLLMGSL